MDRGVGLERVRQAELLADLAHCRHDLLTEQADAGPRILVADRAVIAPQPVNAGPGFFEDVAQFGDHRLWRAVENPAVGDLLFEGWAAARALGPADREL